MSGAFDQLAEDVKKRLDLNRIGFGSTEEGQEAELPLSSFLSKAETRDFINYGFELEFVGRLPVRVSCDELSKDDLAEILVSSEGNVLEQYRDDFGGYEIKFDISDDAIEKIAELAAHEKTGARGLVTILERTFRDFKFELPSTPIRKFSVDGDLIADPKSSLASLLEENRDQLDDSMLEDVDRFVVNFKRDFGYELKFRKPAKVAVVKQAMSSNRSVRAICEKSFPTLSMG